MENQDKNTNNSHPKPSDDAQALVETIIPSSETEESKTTEVKPLENQKEEQPVEQKQEEPKSEKQNVESAKVETEEEDTSKTDDIMDQHEDKANAKKEKDKHNEGGKIETVVP